MDAALLLLLGGCYRPPPKQPATNYPTSSMVANREREMERDYGETSVVALFSAA
jgi:hypothetical protein